MSPRIGFVQISHSAKKIALMNLSLVVESIRLIEVRARTCLCKLLNTHIDDVIKTEKIFQETETATRPSARLKTTNKTKRKCQFTMIPFEKIRVVITRVPDRPMPMSDEEHDRRPSRACRQSVGDDYYYAHAYA